MKINKANLNLPKTGNIDTNSKKYKSNHKNKLKDSLDKDKFEKTTNPDNKMLPYTSLKEIQEAGRRERELIHTYYDNKLKANEEKYNEKLEEIKKQSEIEEEEEKKRNIIKARAIIKKIARGIEVSPEEYMFAKEILPEEFKKALAEAKRSKS